MAQSLTPVPALLPRVVPFKLLLLCLLAIAAALPAAPPPNAWFSLGPSHLQAQGGVFDDPFETQAGRITGIAPSPTDPNTIYVATGGGVWKTTNGGAFWMPLTDDQPVAVMGALVMAPGDPNTLYAGSGFSTGESIGGPYIGMGVLKTTDAGATWTLLGKDLFYRRCITRMAVSPIDAQTVYAAVAPGEIGGLTDHTGIWKSTDGGLTWTNTTTSISDTARYTDLVMNPDNPNILYAAIGDARGSAVNSVYVTYDAGATWSCANFPIGPTLGTIKLAIAPSSPQTLYAAVIAPGQDGAIYGINISGVPITMGLLAMLKTTDGGTNWTQLPAGIFDCFAAQGYFASTMAVDPSNPDSVYKGGTLDWLYFYNAGLQWSEDGGTNWNMIAAGDYTDTNGILVTTISPHGDYHALAFDANGQLLVGTDGGIWRLKSQPPPLFDPTLFLQNPAIQWDNLNGNLRIAQFYSVTMTASGQLFAGTQDNGIIQSAGLSADNWRQDLSGDGFLVRADQTPRPCVYAGYDGAPGLWRTYDLGKTWDWAGTGIPTSEFRSVITPFVIDPALPRHLLLGVQRLYESFDHGDHWIPRSTPFKKGWNTDAGIDSIAIAANRPQFTYVSAGGHILVSEDGRQTWHQRDIPGFSDYLWGLKVWPGAEKDLLAVRPVAGGLHVFYSPTAGKTWYNFSGNLSDLPAYALEIDPHSGLMYIGTQDGVYSSADGLTWTRVGTGLPHVPVLDLQINEKSRLLLAATHGRGAWAISLNRPR